MFENAPKLKEPAPFYLPESEASYFTRRLKKEHIPYKLTPCTGKKQEGEPEYFRMPPFELGIRLTRLCRLDTKLDPAFLLEAFYSMLEEESYQEEKDAAFSQALEDDRDYNQPGIWVNRKK